MTVQVHEMFGAGDPTEIATKFEAYKSALNKSSQEQEARKAAGAYYVDQLGWIAPERNANEVALETLSKSLDADSLASVRDALSKAGQVGGDINKDFTLTSPLSTGYVPYDLDAPAKFLAPMLSPLRNLIPRVKGQGLAKRYKRITGVSGSSTGGVANIRPSINDASSITVGSLNLLRGPKISYAGDEFTINYKQFGLSDVVPFSAEFAGQGFQDIRQLSKSSVLMASMVADEKMILGGRGTDAGLAGALATPTAGNIALTVRTAGANETGNSAFVPTAFVRVSAEGFFGESISTAEITTTGLSAATGKLLDITMSGAAVNGATGYRVYVGSATGIPAQFFSGRTALWGGVSGVGTAAFTINFTGGGTGGVPSVGAVSSVADTSAIATDYDGILSVCLDNTRSGGIRQVNGKLSVSTPGAEFQDLFAALYSGGVSNVQSGGSATGGGLGFKANPDHIWMHGLDRKQLSNTVITGGTNVPAFYMTSAQPQNGVTAGAMVAGIVNEITGKALQIDVHPWLPQGTALCLSESLPIPDSNVPNPIYYSLPQDYMGIDWPVIQHTYDTSSYWFGALIMPAPQFMGCVAGIQQG